LISPLFNESLSPSRDFSRSEIEDHIHGQTIFVALYLQIVKGGGLDFSFHRVTVGVEDFSYKLTSESRDFALQIYFLDAQRVEDQEPRVEEVNQLVEKVHQQRFGVYTFQLYRAPILRTHAPDPFFAEKNQVEASQGLREEFTRVPSADADTNIGRVVKELEGHSLRSRFPLFPGLIITDAREKTRYSTGDLEACQQCMSDKMSSPSMNGQKRTRLPEGPFDLAIIGGGINGAAIARDAVLRGHSVCLCEREDFSYGTSSRSSKMLHGGMRYLENLHFGLVFESLRERALQLKLAPHLTGSQTFVIPVYEGARRGLRWIRLGIWLYDLLSLGRRLGVAQKLTPEEILTRVPNLKSSKLLGGGLYFDGVMDDARLSLANILDAREAATPGQLQIRSYAEVTAIKESAPIELQIHDRILDLDTRVFAHHVIRAVGPWADNGTAKDEKKHLLAPSKGVHLVLPAFEASELGPHGLLLTHSSDGRVFFVVPWHNKAIVGTTESPVNRISDGLRATPEEVEYLLSELRALFPSRNFSSDDVLATFSGVRPLARSVIGGKLGRVSRVHRLIETSPRMFTLVGGKYTTYRAIAKDVLDRVIPGKKSITHRRPLTGGEDGPWENYAKRNGRKWIAEFGEQLVNRLFHRYGTHLSHVLRLVQEKPELGEPLCASAPEIRAEVVHSVVEEEVCYPADFIERRTHLRFERGNGRDAYNAIEELIREHGTQLGRVPPDLDLARERFFDELSREDQLRQPHTANLRG